MKTSSSNSAAAAKITPMPPSDLYTFDSYDDDVNTRSTSSPSLVAVSPKMYLHNSTPPSSTASADGLSSPQMMYADEASLYSIAEDSREGRASEFTTPSAAAGGAAAAAFNYNSNNNEYGGEDNDFGIEMTIDDEDDNASATQFYNYEQRLRRRRLLAASAFLICLLFALVAVTIAVTQTDEDSSRSVVSEGLVDGEDVIPPPTSTPTFEDTTRQQAETLVVLAVDGCPGDRTDLMDATTPQNQVFEALVDEVVSQASFDSRTGIVTWDERHAGGVEYLREKFALDMLYMTTVGDSWTEDEQWMGPTDPCDGWTGVVCDDDEAEPREGGTCAVTSLELDFNNLGGYLPEEFCCMPCLKHISMANNNIGGDILTCLVEIPTLESIEFVGNNFGTTAEVRMKYDEPLSRSSPP